MADLSDTAYRYLAVAACVAALTVVGGLFVRDPTGSALAPFFVAVLAVGGHALSVDAATELAYATLVCVGAALAVGLLVGVGAALAGGSERVGVNDTVLSVTLAAALLAGYLVARRRT